LATLPTTNRELDEYINNGNFVVFIVFGVSTNNFHLLALYLRIKKDPRKDG